ncbi:hypothetical protein JCM14467A_24490 [Vulcanisaeta sp. JCM 14467]
MVMKAAAARNYAVFLSLIVGAPLIITILIGPRSPYSIITFLIILDIVIAISMAATYLRYRTLANTYYRGVLDFYSQKPVDLNGRRVAILVVSYNEDPLMVAQNALVSSLSVGPENVYVLDDSTDPTIVTRLKLIAERTGFNYVHRDNRRGYKAGAINDWLRAYGDKYDYAMILDADQMLLPGVIGRLLKFFDDDRVAFVQIPQYYSNTRTWIGMSSWIQQLPFLRVVMRARDVQRSPFMLGSGTLFKIRPLLEVGGFNEDTVTEDIYTSLELLERGYYGRYIDVPALWSGEPPQSYTAYWVQQSRWSLGGFQLLPRLLNASIVLTQFWDYLNGVLYWFKVSILALAEVVAPVLFIFLNAYYFRYAQLFFIIYIPIFFFLLYNYLLSMKRYKYGLRAFLAHYSLQSIDSFPTTLSFLTWITGRKRPFKVTPKGGGTRTPIRLILPTLIIIGLLLAASILGIMKLLEGANFWYRVAVAVNLFWALWLLTGYGIGLFLIVGGEAPSRMRRTWKQKYMPELFEVSPLVHYAVELETAISHYDEGLAVKLGSDDPRVQLIRESSRESVGHAKVYAQIADTLGIARWSSYSPVLTSFLDTVMRRVSESEAKCLSDSSKGLDSSCLLIDEELMMRMVAQLVKEVLGDSLTEEMIERLDRIIDEETEHFYAKLYLINALQGEPGPIALETKGNK